MLVAASAYLGINFAKGIIEQGDAWAMMQSKLKLATGSSEEAKKTQMELFDLAQKMRVPLADSAQLYNRMTIPMQKLGKSSQETMGMVESMGLALKLSGATAQEASSVMLQFSQSMNAGRLNGGEFNAVAEGAPIILRAIEEELRRTGKWGENTTETLKKMGSEGKISAELLAGALTNALPKFREDFETLPMTVDGALQRVKNSWMMAIGTMSQNTKLNEELARTIGSIERAMPKIAEFVVNAFVTIHDNMKPILIMISSILALNFVSWLAATIVAVNGLAVAFGIAGTALAAIPFLPVIAALGSAAYSVGYLAAKWLDSKFGAEEAAKANTSYKTSITDTVAKLDAENEQLDRQYKLIKGINEEKGKATSAPTSDVERDYNNLVSAIESNTILIEKFRKMRDEGKGKPMLLSNLEQETERLRSEAGDLLARIDRNAAKVKRNKDAVDEDNRIKYRAEINKKLKFDEKALMQEEIDNLDKSRLSAEDYAKAVAKIREGYASGAKSNKVQLDYLEKANAAYKEQLEKLKELSGFGGDGKRTASEKEIITLQERLDKVRSMNSAQAEAANIDKNAEITLINKAIAVRKLVADLEAQVLVSQKYNDEVKKAVTHSEEEAKTAEDQAEKHRKLAESVGKAADEFARLGYEKAKADLEDMKAFGGAGFESVIKNQERLVEAKRKIYEYTKLEKQEKSREKVAEVMGRVNKNPAMVDEAEKEKLRLQAQKDRNTVNAADLATDPLINTEQKRADVILAINKKLAEDLNNIDYARVQVQLTSAESIAGSLASIAANTAGKQSGIYKAMFAVQKGFAIAKAIMDIQMAVSSASWSLPFPANLGAMATVAASGASIVSNIMSLGYEKGGYTGNYGTSEVAGVVHGQEFVVNASGTQRHRALLEAINSGKDPAMIDNVINMSAPTSVASSNGGMNVKVENYGTSIETQQISQNEIRIIARQEASRAVRKESGGVVAAAIAAPNSNVSKALGRNTQTQRRRN